MHSQSYSQAIVLLCLIPLIASHESLKEMKALSEKVSLNDSASASAEEASTKEASTIVQASDDKENDSEMNILNNDEPFQCVVLGCTVRLTIGIL